MKTAHDVADMVRQEFRYWGTVPPLCHHTDEEALRLDYQHQSGRTHWFDADTLRFFGSRNRHMVRPGLMVETQTKAPEGVGRYVVVAWVVDETQPKDHRSMGRITPQKVGGFHSLRDARRFAVDAFASWPTGAVTDDASTQQDESEEIVPTRRTWFGVEK